MKKQLKEKQIHSVYDSRGTESTMKDKIGKDSRSKKRVGHISARGWGVRKR